MTTFHVLAALFAVYMLVRHGPRVVALLRSREQRRSGAVIPIMNVVLAVVILAAAVKALVSGLISR